MAVFTAGENPRLPGTWPKSWIAMADAFKTKIRAALQDAGLQSALDGNAERRLLSREQAITSLDEDWQVLRRRAHQVRQRTIANLEGYLEEFIRNAQANGLIVHRAADARQAVEIVLDIARQHGARRIAKAKTMVSEEIHLNQALEAAGLQVVETDLGEYIIQLRGEHPAHIITPAVHLRRSDVGQTFHEKLGMPLTDDIPTMTAVARRKLRQTFLNADIGISGVNFGVAQTGTLCLVTNEGNGRMVTTIPPVHIALMGMERLVPGLDDLALMLLLLPRSATGQKMTVYTSLINRPRQPEEVDGASERHLVIVDNGRRALRNSPLAESLLCIRCGACLNACPVFREIGGHAYVGVRGENSTYPGPIGSVISPGLFGQAEFGHLAQASSLCGACKEACPVDIDLPKMLLRVRDGGLQPRTNHKPPGLPMPLIWGLRVYTWFAVGGRRFALAQKLAGIFSRLVSPRQPWLRLPAISGWGYSRDFPRPVSRTFKQRWEAGEIALAVGDSDWGENEREASAAPMREQTVQSGASSRRVEPSLPERFEAELAALGGVFTPCVQDDLADKLISLLRQLEIETILAWEDRNLPRPLRVDLERAGIAVKTEPDPSVQAGLTGALAGIADTGTLVLAGGYGQMLSASLLPEIHIALLPASRISGKLVDVIGRSEIREASSVVLVSGPSRTADIEMTLTIGVHGPREIHVFCLLDL
jgi:L-lactate dehydrogenase complex protein LldF